MSARGAALIVFAKEPRAGQVKTRLCPPLTPQQAAELYAAMLDDVLEASARSAARLGLHGVLAVEPPAALERMRERAPRGFALLAQRGADLGERMECAVADLAEAGYGPLLLRGSDSPLLGEELVASALAALAGCDLALAPDRDGGYQLAALRAPCPGLFRHTMSTAQVSMETLRRGKERGLRTALLREGFDIDVVEDLQLLRDAPRALREALCPRTGRWLGAFDEAAARMGRDPLKM